jgi:hypothetical protein
MTEPPPAAAAPSSTFLPPAASTAAFTNTAPPTALEQIIVPNLISVSTLTFTPTSTATKTATHTATSTATNTYLPPVPDFEELLSFGAGGGGGFCNGIDYAPNDARVSQTNKAIWLCLYLRKIKFSQPFNITLMRLGDGTIMFTPDLRLNQENKTLTWTGYQESNGSAAWTSDGTLNFYNVGIWWPQYFSAGQWRLSVVQNNTAFKGFSMDFKVEEDFSPRIDMVGATSMVEIIPNYYNMFFSHPLKLKANGRADLIGRGFPSNAIVYILLYENQPPPKNLRLVHKYAVMTNSNGSISSEVPYGLQVDKTYLSVAVSDLNVPIAFEGEFNDRLPSDKFVVEPSGSAASSSCPGAPPQRMIVNQRGYVCTRRDPVRLRVSPTRSASTLIELDTGTQFNVIGGPSCSDNWSWWNIRLDNGTTGWVSEGGDEIDPYFICPLP